MLTVAVREGKGKGGDAPGNTKAEGKGIDCNEGAAKGKGRHTQREAQPM